MFSQNVNFSQILNIFFKNLEISEFENSNFEITFTHFLLKIWIFLCQSKKLLTFETDISEISKFLSFLSNF